jgi:hypothetical protein
MGFVTARKTSGLGYTYYPSANPFHYSNPTGTDANGGSQNFNPNYYATPAAAQQFADALGGQVVHDPTAASFDQNQPMLAVRLPDGTTVNAGAIAQVLGNDAAYGNANVKSGEIAKLFGAQYQPGIAEALMNGTSVDLQPGMPAPGYNPTPFNQPLVDAAAKAAAAASPTTTTPTSTTTTTPTGATPTTATTAATVATITAQLANLPTWALPAAAVALILLLRG